MTEVTALTLTDFLLARISEDEETARAADGPRWFHQDKVVSFEVSGPDGDWVDASAPISVDTRANGWHIINWSPDRVLAECEAKRQIVEDFTIADEDYRTTRSTSDEVRRLAALLAVARVASVYSDHPDYRDEWRP